MANQAISTVGKFRVELQMIFAFHEDRLVPVLQSRGMTKEHIVKQLSDQDRADVGTRWNCDWSLARILPTHHGWVLARGPHDGSDHKADWQTRLIPNDGPEEESVDLRAGRTKKYRTYWTEHLEIVRSVLLERGMNIEPCIAFSPNPIYTNFKVCNDASLFPLSEDQKHDQLTDRVAAGKLDEWDTVGIELMSDPLEADDPLSFRRIDEYLTALRGDANSTHGIQPSKHAGLHVHVEFGPNDPPLSILHILHHLAYMYVLFEPVIVKLFPPHRDGSREGNHICPESTKSNRASLIKWHSKHSNRRKCEILMLDLGFDIFSTTSATSLRRRIQFGKSNNKYQLSMYNIAKALNEPGSQQRTVEFRIHEGTTNARDVEQWVRFCQAFCRAAERQANKTTQWNGTQITGPYSHRTEYRKYQTKKMSYEATTDDLFDFLNLDDDLREYWQSRWERYHDDNHLESVSPGPNRSTPLYDDRDSDGDEPNAALHDEEITDESSDSEGADSGHWDSEDCDEGDFDDEDDSDEEYSDEEYSDLEDSDLEDSDLEDSDQEDSDQDDLDGEGADDEAEDEAEDEATNEEDS